MSSVSGWQPMRMDEMGEIVSGATPATNISNFWDGDIAWVTPYDLSRLKTPYLFDSVKKITFAGLAGASTHLLPARSLVMSSRAPIGYLALPEIDFCTNQGCKSFKLKPEINPVFAYYNVAFNMDKIKNLGEGTTFAEISKTALATVQMDFPRSYLEQSKIAEVLATVDQAIEQTEALIAKQQRIKTGLMQDLLTRGMDEHGQLRTEQTHAFKDSPLGRIPVEWEIAPIEAKLREIIDYRGRTPVKTDAGIPLITAKNVREGYLSALPKEFIAEDAYEAWMTRGIPAAGDVMLTTEAPMGNVARVPSYRIALAQRLITLPANSDELSSDFLFWLLHWSQTLERLTLLTSGSTVVGIKQSVFRRVLFAFPVLEEQLRIAKALDVDKSIADVNLKELTKLQSLKKALMQDLLTGRKRVTDLLESSAA